MLIRGKLKDKTFVCLLLILLLAVLLRIPYLHAIPMGFNCDEALNGYEAYSISETLRDHYGKFLPIFTRSFNSYRPTLYIFTAIPFVKILGLNEFAVRLPSAISGVLTVLFVYLIAKQLLNQRVAMVSACLLAVNPLYIHFNRFGNEVNLLPLLFCLGFWLFLVSRKQPRYLILSAIIFGLSLNTYHSARVFVPLFLLGIILIFWRHLIENWKKTLFSFLAFNLIFIPLARFWISPAGMARASQVGFDLDIALIVQNYLSFFSPEYLFFKGYEKIILNPVGMGCLYSFELVTVLSGFLYLLLKGNQAQKSLLLWLALYPMPAALFGSATPIRSLVGIPLFAMISGCGFVHLETFLRSRFRVREVFRFSAVFLLMVSFVSFGQRYFLNFPSEVAMKFKFGTREAIDYAEQSGYDCIVMSSDRNSMCFALSDFIFHVPFYIQYPPEQYQKSPIQPWTRGSRDKIYSIEKYQLLSLVKQPALDDKCLYIVRPDEIPEIVKKGYGWKEITTIKDAAGIEHFKLIEINEKNNS